MPPMDPATRLYTIDYGGHYFENFIVLNSRTWEEADRHCKQYNLRLGYTTLTDMKMIHDKFKQLMGRNEPDAIIWRAVMLPDE
ncbi:hypothetical protein Q1695_013253 [Nippostrongylus brasiliensis]|nr:hypothetical protein Q1695_013253 [Nippostrongylus brasiliensis]